MYVYDSNVNVNMADAHVTGDTDIKDADTKDTFTFYAHAL